MHCTPPDGDLHRATVQEAIAAAAALMSGDSLTTGTDPRCLTTAVLVVEDLLDLTELLALLSETFL